MQAEAVIAEMTNSSTLQSCHHHARMPDLHLQLLPLKLWMQLVVHAHGRQSWHEGDCAQQQRYLLPVASIDRCDVSGISTR